MTPSDDRFDPLANALRREAAGLSAPPARARLRSQVLARLDEAPPRRRPPLILVLGGGLAAAASLLLVLQPDRPPTSPQTPASPAPALVGFNFSLPRLDPQRLDLARLSTDRPYDQEIALVEADLQRFGRFVQGILPGNPSGLELL